MAERLGAGSGERLVLMDERSERLEEEAAYFIRLREEGPIFFAAFGRSASGERAGYAGRPEKLTWFEVSKDVENV